jgi:hypothetical protein
MLPPPQDYVSVTQADGVMLVTLVLVAGNSPQQASTPGALVSQKYGK